MAIIAMTREMGTLGKEVAREFARRKGYTVIHHELIETDDDRSRKREESEVYRFLEGSEEELQKWRHNRAGGGYLTPAEVLEMALGGEVLIRGWGAARLLKAIPNVLAVRVCAPMEFRIAQMEARLGIDTRQARREIEHSDAAHSRTFLRFFEADWRDPLNYDVVLNTAHLDPNTCADILVDAASNPAFAPSEASRREIEDRLIEARIRAAIRADPLLARRGRHVQVSVSGASVRLFGVVTDGQSRRVAADIAAAQEGVEEMHNEIAHASGFTD